VCSVVHLERILHRDHQIIIALVALVVCGRALGET
jgi:hypothetical protein